MPLPSRTPPSDQNHVMQEDLFDLDNVQHWDASHPSRLSRIATTIDKRLEWWKQKHEQDWLDRYRSIASF